MLPCDVRDAAHPVLSQHPLNGAQHFGKDAIGFGQGGNFEEGSYLRLQVQNYAAHGIVGYLFPCPSFKFDSIIEGDWRVHWKQILC